MRQETKEIRKQLTDADNPITEAEVYAAKAIREELEASRIRRGSRVWRMVTLRAARVMSAHRQEVRDMYRTSKALLREWITKESGLRDFRALSKLNEIGLTGNVLKDLEILEGRERR